MKSTNKKLYAIYEDKNRCVHPFGKPIRLGRKWAVESPVKKPNRILLNGVQERLYIYEQSDNTFNIFDYVKQKYYDRNYKTLEDAHKAASDILKKRDCEFKKECNLSKKES